MNERARRLSRSFLFYYPFNTEEKIIEIWNLNDIQQLGILK